MKVLSFYWPGFTCLSGIKADGLRTVPVAASRNIKRGDALHITSGYATNATTAFDHTLLGVAVSNADNSAGGNGDITVQYIPFVDSYRYAVPVEADALITQASVGAIVDLEAVGTIDISDAKTGGPGFRILDFDASDNAKVANTYGYAIGQFEVTN